ITPKIDLTSALTAEVHFDYAYAKYGGGYEDGFRIDISTDCWATYDSIWYAFGDNLSTVPNNSSWWEPADCADWAVNTIVDITNYVGQFVQIRFVGLNGWGNNFYMDNVNVTGLINGIPENGHLDVSIYPNPSTGNFIVEHSMVKPVLKVLSLDGRLITTKILNSTKETINLDVSSGIYLVHLVSGENKFVQRIVVE
ncbi:MAG: T9SS type A sorting domain-containing protein, partial [Crocinitomicaceae bacterium]|nr:T9SS type A sorting domain-containing protein [Crocinitomicaceae bacterium]